MLNKAIRFSSISTYDTTHQENTSSHQYSWSVDGVCWSGWCNIDQYYKIGPNIESDFYLRILFEGAVPLVFVCGLPVDDYTVCQPPYVPESSACENPNLFNPYANLDCALHLQQHLADSVICLFGIPIYYFRCDPDYETKDLIFKEYSMHHVVDCKQLKLMISDGQMPSSNPKLTDFDFDWEVDWETELSKTQFARAFGDHAYPKARDFLYIPMMKRMWEVNAAYDEKNEGLLWRSTTWKLSLVKYNENTSLNNNEYDSLIDSLIGDKYYDNIIGQSEDLEQDRISGYSQINPPQFAPTNLYNIFMEDAIRKSYTKDDVDILEKIYCHHHNIVARNIYKFKNKNGCIVYQKGYCGDSGAISLLLETQGYLDEGIDVPVAEFGPIHFHLSYDTTTSKYKITVDGLSGELDLFGTYMLVYRWDRPTFTRELRIFRQVHREDIPIYKIRPEHYWFDFGHPTTNIMESYNNDYISRKMLNCQIHAWPLYLANIKLYDQSMDWDEIIKESTLYITNSNKCVFADLVKPIADEHGYMVR